LNSLKIGYQEGCNELNNVVAYMDEHLREFPDRIALRWVSRTSLQGWDGQPTTPLVHDQISYRDFSLRINRFAQGLKNIGIQGGDRVIIFLPMSLDMYTAMFAVQRIGAISVFLDSWARRSHLGASADCVTPKAMISFEQAFALVNDIDEFKGMPIRILFGPGTGGTHQFQSLFTTTSATLTPVESENTALITFTTGTTGTPKGANRTHRFLSAQHLALSKVIPYTESDIDMPAFPIFSLNNLASGVTTILPALDLAAPSERDPALLACQIINEKINCTTLSPSMLAGLSRYCHEHQIQLSGLRRVVTGGAPISQDDVEHFYQIAPQSELWILYGSTEAEPMAHIEGREMIRQRPDSHLVAEGVNVGEISEDLDYKFIKLIKGPIDLNQTAWSEIEVVQKNAEGQSKIGEFICTGDHVCRDYYNNPDAFKSTKILDHDGRIWHRTGDLAYLDKHKNLWMVGRVNNAIERKGKYYFPVRAEVLLKKLDFVYRCGFLGIPDTERPEFGETTVAAIELHSDIDRNIFDFKNAKQLILQLFAEQGIPLDQIYFVTQVPMDPRHHSKVEYQHLRELIESQSGVLLA
jgi:acyl-CoA synthetase (AMP-forming)/AMP-acid ligase II